MSSIRGEAREAEKPKPPKKKEREEKRKKKNSPDSKDNAPDRHYVTAHALQISFKFLGT